MYVLLQDFTRLGLRHVELVNYPIVTFQMMETYSSGIQVATLPYSTRAT